MADTSNALPPNTSAMEASVLNVEEPGVSSEQKYKARREKILQLAIQALGPDRVLGPIEKQLMETLAGMDERGDGKAAERYREAPLRRGPRANVRADALSQIAGELFFQLTGKQPTRHVDAYADSDCEGGPFHEFLASLAEILDLPLKPAHYVRKTIELRQGVERTHG